MALGPRLDLRQSQSLVMTPQLQQAIRLLALSNLEVEGFIAEEIERNPLLDTAGGADDGPSEPAEIEPPPRDEAATVDDLVMTGDGIADAPLDMDFDSEDFHQDSASDSMRGLDGSLGLTGDHGGAGGGGEGPDLDSFADAHEVSLQEHLAAQAGERLSGTDLMVAQQLIDQIDEAGYLRGPLLELAQRLGVPLRDVERVLAIVQGFDPPGIAARTLSECLALQAKEADRYDPAMARLIANLDYLAKGNLGALRRICAVDDEDLADMIRELRAFDPKPGCKFMRAEAGEAAVVPDVFIARRAGGWAIELNNATLPRLLVNRSYYTELSGGAQDRKSKAWLSECLQSANWLVKALDQRARTIVKVATEIVKQQDGFFRHGVAQLRPLTLRQVAEAIGMHESTVSRVTSNKYLSCDRGLYELKYFFRSGIQSNDGGDAASSEAVKSHIKALIAAEDTAQILSDDQLVEMLRAKGFDIARRTVAKYREALGIGSSVQRRRQNAIGSRAA
ncbi:MAG TPA: RNA polymerase factor sigma-54 [Allosphingosinicella sp.]|nr:RNA polymerase factor sigma-54 [Allosphingosinicella sp.]